MLICRECLNIASDAVKPRLAGEGRFASRMEGRPDTTRGYDGYLPRRIVSFPEARRGQLAFSARELVSTQLFDLRLH
jgi:hypothetical protein